MTWVFKGIQLGKEKRKGLDNKPPLSFRRFNLSLAGCSPAEPVSVSIEHFKYQFIYTIFATCLKRQPLTFFY